MKRKTNPDDYVGKKIEHLKIKKVYRIRDKNGVSRIMCDAECDCGKIIPTRLESIKSGKTKSCGCSTQFEALDLRNQKFGRLKAIKPTHKDEHGAWYWECKCKCEKIVEVCASSLTSGRTTSCGCYDIERRRIDASKEESSLMKYNKKVQVDNTRLDIIKREQLMSRNKSGTTGVSWDKSKQKWIAQITFQKKNYNLGRYEKKEDAIKARKDAEKRLYKPIIEKYELPTN